MHIPNIIFFLKKSKQIREKFRPECGLSKRLGVGDHFSLWGPEHVEPK